MGRGRGRCLIVSLLTFTFFKTSKVLSSSIDQALKTHANYCFRHAPMVVIGKEPIDFVVVQFANGVDIEDCQEAELEKQTSGGLSVVVPSPKKERLSKL